MYKVPIIPPCPNCGGNLSGKIAEKVLTCLSCKNDFRILQVKK